MFLEQIGELEKENALLSKELQEVKEVEEFESLEEEFRKEHEVSFLTLQSGEERRGYGFLWFDVSLFGVFCSRMCCKMRFVN